jgi:uncharacterized damage-inducible protein DinB
MKTFFKELFDYNYDVNQKLGDIFHVNADRTSEKAVNLYNHILNSHQIWNNRIDARHPAFGVWEIHTTREFREIDSANYEHTLFIIDQLDLDNTINYPKIKGKPFSKRISEILFHVINHSTYHRGQIATEFRQSGLDPLATDYIFHGRG